VSIGTNGGGVSECIAWDTLPENTWYTFLLTLSVEEQSVALLCMTQTQIRTFADMLTSEQLYTLLTTITKEASAHMLTNLTETQVREFVDSISCTQLYTVLTTTSTEGKRAVLITMSATQRAIFTSCLSPTQLVTLLIGNGPTIEALPCELQTLLVRSMPKDALDRFIVSVAQDDAQVNELFSKICADLALYIAQNVSDSTKDLLSTVLTVAAVGAILAGLTAVGQAAWTSAIAGGVAGAASGVVVKPHGGRAVSTIPCTCYGAPAFLITLGGLASPSLIGPHMWISGITQQYSYGNIFPRAWQMGISSKTPVGCYVYTGTTCVAVGGGPLMLKNGTSMY
jgi:hypothetical protein